MVEKVKEEIKEQKEEAKGFIPKQILDELDRTGKPYLLVMKEVDSVIAKTVNGSKIETYTNMVDDAYINSLQSAYQVFMSNRAKRMENAKNKP